MDRDRVAIGDFELVVHGIQNPFVSQNQIITPAPGNKYVAVDAEVFNPGESAQAVSSLAQFDLKDSANQQYTIAITGETAPSLDGSVPGRELDARHAVLRGP